MKTFLKLLLLLLLTSCVFPPRARAQYITATLTVTNTPANGDTLVYNTSSTRIFTNGTISLPGTFITLNANTNTTATNIFTQFNQYPVGSIIASQLFSGSSNVLVFRGVTALTLGGTWGKITFTTNTVTAGNVVSVPFANMATTNRTNTASQLISDLSQYSTTGIGMTSVTATNLVGLTNAQTLGNKTVTNSAWNSGTASNNTFGGNNRFVGIQTNTASTNIGGYYTNAVLDSPFFTNAVNNGNAFSSVGTGTYSEQFGTGAVATNNSSTALGNNAVSFGSASSAIGKSASAMGDNSVALGALSSTSITATNSIAIGFNAQTSTNNNIAIGSSSVASHTNSIAIGNSAATTAANQMMLGSALVSLVQTFGRLQAASITNSTLTGTNVVTGDVSYSRLNVTSLANGNNAAVPLGTNVYFKVSGPSAAFTINGIANGRDGKSIIIQNSTGYAMTLAHDSGVDPTAANRIYTGSGADIVLTNNPTIVTLIYDSAVSRWILGGFSAASVGVAQTSTNGSGFTLISTNPIVSGVNYTNLSGQRMSLSVWYTLTDSTISGAPGLVVSNLVTAEWGQFTNSFVLTGASSASASFLLAPNDIIQFTNKSSGAATATVDRSFAKGL